MARFIIKKNAKNKLSEENSGFISLFLYLCTLKCRKIKNRK